MGLLTPHSDTLITMSRLIYEKHELKPVLGPISFTIDEEEKQVVVWRHDDEKGTADIFERTSFAEVVAAYLGLELETDLDLNDPLTKGDRLGKTGR